MNPELAINIAEAQQARAGDKVSDAQSTEELRPIEDIVEQIRAYQLGQDPDDRGVQSATFDPLDQVELIKRLRPSEDQAKFLGSVQLKLRISTQPKDGPGARQVELVQCNLSTGAITGTLFGVEAIGPDDTTDGSYVLYDMQTWRQLHPGTPEYSDLETMLLWF